MFILCSVCFPYAFLGVSYFSGHMALFCWHFSVCYFKIFFAREFYFLSFLCLANWVVFGFIFMLAWVTCLSLSVCPWGLCTWEYCFEPHCNIFKFGNITLTEKNLHHWRDLKGTWIFSKLIFIELIDHKNVYSFHNSCYTSTLARTMGEPMAMLHFFSSYLHMVKVYLQMHFR